MIRTRLTVGRVAALPSPSKTNTFAVLYASRATGLSGNGKRKNVTHRPLLAFPRASAGSRKRERAALCATRQAHSTRRERRLSLDLSPFHQTLPHHLFLYLGPCSCPIVPDYSQQSFRPSSISVYFEYSNMARRTFSQTLRSDNPSSDSQDNFNPDLFANVVYFFNDDVSEEERGQVSFRYPAVPASLYRSCC